MKRSRRKNPATATLVALAAGAGALAVGLGGAYLWRRRRPLIADEPSIVTSREPPGVVEYGEPTWSWGRATDSGYPWTKPLLHVDNIPTPGMFLDTGDKPMGFDPSIGIDGLVIALLASALEMSGMDPNEAKQLANAQGQDPNAQLGRTLRRDVRRALIEPGSWNDRLFGQTNANYAGGTSPGMPCVEGSGTPNAACTNGIRDPNAKPVVYMMNGPGRGLNWLHVHSNVLDAIGANRTPVRATTLEGEPIGDGTSAMVLWMPAFDLAALREPVPRIRLLSWPGGGSAVDPPPAVMKLGIDMNGVTFPTLPQATGE